MSERRSSITPQDPKVSTDAITTSRILDMDKLQYSHPTTATQSIEASPGFLYNSQSSAYDSVKTSYSATNQAQSEIGGQASNGDWKTKFIQEQKKANDLLAKTDALIKRSMANSNVPSTPYTLSEVRTSHRSYETPQVPIARADPVSVSVRNSHISDPLVDYRYPRSDYRYSVAAASGERYVSTSPHREYVARNPYTQSAGSYSETKLRSSSLTRENYGLRSNELLNRSSYIPERPLTSYRDTVKSQNLSRLNDIVNDIRSRNFRGDNVYSTPVPIRTMPISTESAGLAPSSFERPRESYAYSTVKRSSPVSVQRSESPESKLPLTFKPDLLAGFKSGYDYRDVSNGYRSSLGYMGDKDNKTQIERILSKYKREEFYDPVSTLSHRRFDLGSESLVKSSAKPSGKAGAKASNNLPLKIGIVVIVLLVLAIFGYWFFFW